MYTLYIGKGLLAHVYIHTVYVYIYIHCQDHMYIFSVYIKTHTYDICMSHTYVICVCLSIHIEYICRSIYAYTYMYIHYIQKAYMHTLHIRSYMRM